EGGLVARRRLIPLPRYVGETEIVAGLAGPVAAARAADRRRSLLVEVLEMLERLPRALQETQRQPAGNEFGVGIGDAVLEPVPRRQQIGALILLFLHQAPDDDVALGPPVLGVRNPLRRRHVMQDLDRGEIVVAAALPAQFLEQQRRVAPQLRR